jgi:uncharacterized protein YoxC
MNTPSNWLIAFVALTAFALFVQAIVMLVAFLTVRRMMNKVQADLGEVRTTVMPILTKTKDTLEKVAPKVESIAADVADLTRRIKEEGADAQVKAAEILDRVQRQASRIDAMVTGMVDGVERASNVVTDNVTKPIRQISGALAAAKAFLTVIATGRRPGRQVEIIADQDMFV